MIQHANLDQYAQAVWAAKGFDMKKQAAIDMINNFRFVKKRPHFNLAVQQAKNANEIDSIAAQITLCDKDRVIK